MLATQTPEKMIIQKLPLPSACDIVIVIFWSRMGTPLPAEWKKTDGNRYLSGTEWEYRDALQAAEQYGKPKLLLYRRTEKICLDPDDPAFDENLEQWRQVKKFFADLHNPDGSIRGGCNKYTTPPQFKEKLNQHLRNLLIELAPELRARERETGPDKPSQSDLCAATAHYLSYLMNRHQYLNFKGMGIRWGPLLPLLDVYVPVKACFELPKGESWDDLREEEDIWDTLAESEKWDHRLNQTIRRSSVRPEQRQGGRFSEPKGVLDLLKKVQNGLVILGNPGSGKTTFLKYLALQLARGKGELNLGNYLPILVSLSDCAKDLETNQTLSMEDFIIRYFHNIDTNLSTENLFINALDCGTALIMLDGLDEAKNANLRNLIVDKVMDFYSRHRWQTGNKFVITSRIIGYQEVRLTVPGLVECILVDFDDGEITQFIDRWTLALETQTDGQLREVNTKRDRQCLLQAVKRNLGLRRLAANPLLLTILVLMKQQGINLPERRVELYDQYIKTLLSSKSFNSAHDFDPVQSIKILALLALWIHKINPGSGTVKQEVLRQKLKTIYMELDKQDPERCASQFLDYVHKDVGLLVERGPKEFGFIHLRLEEYLVAVGIALQGQGSAIVICEALKPHLHESYWHEIILLTINYIGLIQQLDTIAGEVVETLIQEEQQLDLNSEAVIIAGEAVLDACSPVGIPIDKKNKIVGALQITMQNTEVRLELRRRAGSILGSLSWLPDDLDIFLKVSAGSFLYGEDKGEDKQEQIIPYDYWIAKYPVTNFQYNHFIKDGGYQRKQFWSDVGWQCHQGREHPQFWNNASLSNPIFPVVGVSWYEAEAYCCWLNEKLHKSGLNTVDRSIPLPEDYIVRLPTNKEWERTARGTDGREYAWGTNFMPNYANTSRANSTGTTAVCTYPQGESPVGAWDMCGNCWEWTSTCNMRGGSWDNSQSFARCSFSGGNLPGFIFTFVGFRVVVSQQNSNNAWPV
jgi:formylglycine-generating enzyme required for sulfatase activity